jgi:ribonuclease HI
MSPTSLVHIHADESCLGNQFKSRANPGGAAGLVEVWKSEAWVRRDYWVSEPDTTNNRMALQSAIVALDLLQRPCRVRFVSDSQYLVKGISEWVHGWKRRGWRRKGGPIENLELWQDLDASADRHSIEWEWVRGHAGHPKNEYVNDLAVRAATDLTDSGGLIASGFEEWLQVERDEHHRYTDYVASLPPGSG